MSQGLRKLFNYLNPIAKLGVRDYSFQFPLLTTVSIVALMEMYAYWIARDPSIVGLPALFVLLTLIIYFSFRKGILGGATTAIVTILYYFYIIYTRHYQGEQLISGIDTTVLLGIIYLLLATIIGWLKQKIDELIDREADEKKRLQTIIQQLPVGVMITDANNRIVQTNRRLDMILGVKIPQGYVVGERPLVQLKQNGKLTNSPKMPLVRALIAQKPIMRKEFTVIRKDGKEFQILVNASPVHNKKGDIIAAAATIADITQQKELEKRKDDFVNMASHELKTPITSMKLYLDSLKLQMKKYHDQQLSQIVNRVIDQTQKLQELVSDLLDVSRLQTGKLSFHRESFRIDQLIREIIDSLQATSSQRIIFSKPIAVSVYGDRFRIYQVLTNLLTNAIKYSSGKGDIYVRLKRVKGNAIVSVQDAGIGIDKAQQKKIFDRLYQVTDAKEKTFPGLGMGLYISKEIIRRHKGKIWVESEKGKGSTFYFSLPK